MPRYFDFFPARAMPSLVEGIFLASIEYELRLSAQRQGGAFHPRISGVPDRPPLV